MQVAFFTRKIHKHHPTFDNPSKAKQPNEKIHSLFPFAFRNIRYNNNSMQTEETIETTNAISQILFRGLHLVTTSSDKPGNASYGKANHHRRKPLKTIHNRCCASRYAARRNNRDHQAPYTAHHLPNIKKAKK